MSNSKIVFCLFVSFIFMLCRTAEESFTFQEFPYQGTNVVQMLLGEKCLAQLIYSCETHFLPGGVKLFEKTISQLGAPCDPGKGYDKTAFNNMRDLLQYYLTQLSAHNETIVYLNRDVRDVMRLGDIKFRPPVWVAIDKISSAKYFLFFYKTEDEMIRSVEKRKLQQKTQQVPFDKRRAQLKKQLIE